MTTYVEQLQVSLNNADEQNLSTIGFKKLPNDLNKAAGGYPIYLWYKEGSTAITRIQVSFNDNMAAGLTKEGYKKINKNLNAGAGGDHIYLWSFHGSGEYDTPIKEIDVTTDGQNEAAKFGFGWQRLACDLNRNAGGAWIHFWVKTEKQTYICDIAATDSYGSDADLFGEGYLRVDENTNRGTRGSQVFIWNRQTTDPKRALTDLQVSTSDDDEYAYQQQDYVKVNVNLNEDAGGHPVYLWYKKGGFKSPIKAIALLVKRALINDYVKAGLTVIIKNLNAFHFGYTEYLCVYQ